AVLTPHVQTASVGVDRRLDHGANLRGGGLVGSAVRQPFLDLHVDRHRALEARLQAGGDEQALELGNGQGVYVCRIDQAVHAVVIVGFGGILGRQHVGDEQAAV